MPRLNKTDWLLDSLIRPVTLFDNLPVMEEAIARFRIHDYVVHEFDCSGHESQEAMFNAVLRSVDIIKQGYTYKNIQAIQFWDLLRDIKIPEESGVVLAFKHFDNFHRRIPESGQQMLSSIAREHFYWLRHGLRLVVCVHSNERNLELEPLLTIRADWNKQATFTELADRRLAKSHKYFAAMKEVHEWLRSHVKSRLKMGTLNRALFDVTSTETVNALVDLDLDASEMIRLLQDYDFSPFEVSEEELKSGSQPRRAASLPILPTPEFGAE